MAKIVTITNPLTGQPAQVDQLDHTAQQIDDGLNIARGVSNPNLLDNWYFGNPVNQRGQTSYTGAGYGIDRWTYHADANVLIKDGYIELSTSIANEIYFMQKFEKSLPIGAIFTFSVLEENGTLTAITQKIGDATVNGVLSSGTGFNLDATRAAIIVKNTTASEIKAVKLELGSTQTLAHQENGVWVLNEIPDYGEQLARCQRYLYVAKGVYRCVNCDANNGCFFPINLPVKMRATPSLIMPSSFVVLTGVTNSIISTFVNYQYSVGLSDSSVQINLKDPSNNKYSLDYSIYCVDNPIYISAEL